MKLKAYGFLLIAILFMATAVKAEIDIPGAMARSLVSAGDSSRLQHALAKARRGEPITFGAIGGSITRGANITNPWASLVADWWRARFPAITVNFINAGIGATGSNIGCHRANNDLLSQNPDFVVADFAVNDGGDIIKETMEGLVRQTLDRSGQPAMMLLFMMNVDGSNVQDQHKVIGDHYGLPLVSYRDAFYPEVQAGRVILTDLQPDGLHPNAYGHQMAALCVTHYLDSLLAHLPPDNELSVVPTIPAPKITDVFEKTALYNASNLVPTVNSNWSIASMMFGNGCNGWASSTPGSVLEFQTEVCSEIGLLFVKTTDRGMVQLKIDDSLYAPVDGSGDGYVFTPAIFMGLPVKTHKVSLELLTEKSPASSSNLFELVGLMTGGRTTPANANNLAQGKLATQSSTAFGGEASRAVDGNTTGSYTSNQVTHTDSLGETWWKVDLGQNYSIDFVKVFNRTDCCLSRLSDYSAIILDEDQNPVWSNHQINAPNPSTILSVGSVQGRYVKIQLTNPGYLTLAEIQVFGTNPNTAQEASLVNSGFSPGAVSAVPNPFSSAVRLNYTLPSGFQGVYQVYNACGQKVFSKALASSLTGNRGSLVWNGRNMQGNTIPSGYYIGRLTGSQMKSVTTSLIYMK